MLRVCLGDRELVMYLYLEASKHIFSTCLGDMFYVSFQYLTGADLMQTWCKFDADLVQI